jgi:hypothetical protein
MRIHRYGYLAAAASVVALTMLSGCFPTTPTPTPTPTASPTTDPTPEPAAVATLQFSGSDVQSLDDGGEQIAVAEFEGGADAVVGFIAEALDTKPEIEDFPAECAAAGRLYDWGELTLVTWVNSDEFRLTIATPEVAGVRLETTGGFAPGDDVSEFIATLPEEDKSPGDIAGFYAFDVVSYVSEGEYTSPVGAIGQAPDGVTLVSVLTPAQWSSFYC